MNKTLFPVLMMPIFLGIIICSSQSCKKDDDPPQNQVPVAEAGSPQSVSYSDEIFSLSGSGIDSDGSITAYLWSQISGPNHSSIENPGSPSTSVKNILPGTYVFQLMVTDNLGATGVDTVSVVVLAPVCTETGDWTGTYATEAAQPVNVTDETFINGGIAQLTNSPWSYYYTAIQLAIPECRIFSADTLKFEVALKNPSSGSYAITDYDVGLLFEGSLDTAIAQYIGYRAQFTKLGLNAKNITNSANLLHVFENWTTLTLETKGNTLSTSIDGTLKESINYAEYSIGELKKLKITFKGSGSIDWVKLYSSNSNKLLMEENFNTNGSSNVVWY